MRSSFTSVVVLAAVAPVALAAPTAFQAVNGHMTGVEAPVHFQRDSEYSDSPFWMGLRMFARAAQQVTGHSHDEVGHVHFQRDGKHPAQSVASPTQAAYVRMSCQSCTKASLAL